MRMPPLFRWAHPAQARAANWSRCWNWFSPADQRRDAGEPSLIAGLSRHVIARRSGRGARDAAFLRARLSG